MYGWRRREDGAVVIWDLATWPTAPIERVPMLAVDKRQAFDMGEARFRALNEAAELEYGIPPGWLAAMEYQESLFNPRAFRVEKRLVDGVWQPIISPGGRPLTGCGLLQITNPALKGHFTDEQLFDAATNIGVGARHIASLIKLYGYDFPKVSAAYNAGSPRPDPKSPWNMIMTGNHVSSEVEALNYFIERSKSEHEHEFVYLTEQAVAQQFSPMDIFDPADLREASPDPVDGSVPPVPSDKPTVPDVALPARREGES